MLINIRSLNKNFHNLEVLIESLKSKAYIVVCTETFILENYQMYDLYGYNSHYNHSKLNRNDGVIIFFNKDITQTTQTLNFGRIKIINTEVILKDGSFLNVSSVYRSHDIPKTEFIFEFSKFLIKKRMLKII